jgi:predicted hydrocarbon binding protein
MSGKLKFEEGKITFTDELMTFFPLDTLKEMTIEATKKGKGGIMELYYYGWHFGYTFTYHYMKSLKLKKFEETFRLIMEVASLIGYGDYKTLEFRQKRYSKFKNIKNPFGLLFYPSKDKVCHFVRGMNAGGGTTLHRILMNGIELECTSMNGQYCLFMNCNNDILQRQFSKITAEQLDLVWLKPKQLALIKSFGEYATEYQKYPAS